MNTYPFVPHPVHEIKAQPNLMALLSRYLRRWPWFVATVILSLVAAYVYLRYQPPIYSIQASVLVKDEKKGISEQALMKEMDTFTESKVVENEIDILKSFTLMTEVVKTLGLDVRYFRQTPTYRKEVYGESPIRLVIERPTPRLYAEPITISFLNAKEVQFDGQSYPINQSVNTPFGRLRFFARQSLSGQLEPITVSVLPLNQAIEGYLSNLKIEPTAKLSTMLFISLNDPVPDKGEAVVNQLISQYNQRLANDKQEEATSALQFIDNRLGLISGELSTVEKKLETYKATRGITDLGVQSQTFLAAVKENDAQLNDVNTRLYALTAVDRYIKNHSEGQVFAPSTLGLNDPVLLDLLAKVSELELKQVEMGKTVLPDHPIYQSINGQLKSAKASIQDNVQTLRSQLTNSRDQLMSSNGRAEKSLQTVPGKERVLLDINRQQDIKNSLYTYLLQKREETVLSAASAVSKSRAVDWAHTASQPVKPLKMLVFGFASLIGLLVPFGFITVRDMKNNHVLFRSDVEEATEVPILGEVVKARQIHKEGLVFRPGMQSVLTEQIRALRTNLQFVNKDAERNKVVLFTSSISGEGKSFLSLNLGASYALINRKTVIVDLDMRRPKLHKSLHMGNGLGVSNYLRDQVHLESLLRPILGYENYYVITAGSIPSNPSELLNSERLQDLFAELRSQFDFVLIDSPPIGLVTDAQLIAPAVDVTLFVVRHDHTPKRSLKMIDALSKAQHFPNLYIVLNGIGRSEAYNYAYNYDEYRELTKRDA